jgi:hypothetical protein
MANYTAPERVNPKQTKWRAILHDIWRIRNGMAQFCVSNAPARFGLTKYRGKKDAKKLTD